MNQASYRTCQAIDGLSGFANGARSKAQPCPLDINLPDISGYQALKILHSDPVTAHIPVVALSANAMPRDIKKGLRAGFFRYITKPIMLTEFMEAMDAMMEFAEKNLASANKAL